ncbi:MAG TPA: CxxxxCH/CxxCH domain-containing protein [Bacteroidetes bacterium]|nr:CXXCH motif [bacterium BMS3Bbin04]HDO64526.1 CxxxxCH/CxxCH domain-containing protein [Bacteroidota bacterium]HEX03651.1 CxxxxCH/CxxCH domain-containing protein [Bacteroidota bacterium]
MNLSIDWGRNVRSTLISCIIVAAFALLIPCTGLAQFSELDELQPPHDDSNAISCPSCHVPYGTVPDPVPADWITTTVCWSCHAEGGVAQYQNVHSVGVTMYCEDCHNPHMHQSQFSQYYLDETIITPNSGNRRMAFNDSTDFIHGAVGYYQPYDGVCETCHTQTNYHRNNASGDHDHNVGTNCIECHTHENGFIGSCDSCHDSPPQTGAHLAHFDGDTELAAYGETDNISTTDSYIFSCGTCHPISGDMHQNGTVNIELYSLDSPAGSLKSLNPDSAGYAPGPEVFQDAHGIDYTLGTCSNVYCHSETEWSSPDPISQPLIDGDGYIMLDENGNLVYDPYVVTTTPSYTDMNWGDTGLTCNSCHRNAPQTLYPEVQAGVGNSHATIDEWGYENLHAYNMSFAPLGCRTCHYNTVTLDMTWTRIAGDITIFDDVAIANKSAHVNGFMDVVFDTVNTITYNSTFSTANIAYDHENKTCSDVACHLAQTTPEWGKPYRWGWGSVECDQCHRYGGPWPPLAARDVHPVDMQGLECIDCHDVDIHGGGN